MRHSPTLAALAAVLSGQFAWSAEPLITPPITPKPTQPLQAEGRPIVVHGDAERGLSADALCTQAELDRVPGGTSLIPEEVLRQGRTATLRDALQTVPGVYVQPRFGTEESRLSIRGSGVSRTFHLRGVMLLQDGQPINAADGSADFQAIDAALSDHVAIHRGGNALADGGSTLGGSIAFTSPTGLSADTLRLRGEGGSFGYLKMSGDGGFQHDRLDGWLGVSGYTLDGYRVHSEQQNLRAFGNLGYQLEDNVENRLFLSFTDSDSQLPGSLTKAEMESDPTQAGFNAENRDIKRDYPLLRVADRLQGSWGGLEGQLGLGYMQKDLFHPLTFGLIDQESEDWSLDGRLVDSSATLFTLPTRVTVGGIAQVGETEAKTFTYADPNGHVPGTLTSDGLQTAQTTTVYGELDQDWGQGWSSIIGVQYVHATRDFADRLLGNGDQSGSRTWTGINPKIGARWTVDETFVAFGNISRSFEPPTFSEYVQTGPTFVSAPVDIEAQTAWTIEVGSRGRSGLAQWDATLYHALVEDEYLSYVVSPGLSNFRNADATVHSGIELGLGLTMAESMALADDRLSFDQQFTWGRFRFDDDAVYGDHQLPGLPEFFWRGELRYELSRWIVAVIGEWQDGWPVDYANTISADAAFLLGLRIGLTMQYGLSGFCELRNLTDEVYAATTGIANEASAVPVANQQLYNPGDGRSFTLGLEWTH